jgi:hypothetical protein
MPKCRAYWAGSSPHLSNSTRLQTKEKQNGCFNYNARLAAKFIGNARRPLNSGEPDGTSLDQIVTAYVLDRADWLPASCENFEQALEQIAAHDEIWCHTMTAVKQMDLGNSAEMTAERL